MKNLQLIIAFTLVFALAGCTPPPVSSSPTRTLVAETQPGGFQVIGNTTSTPTASPTSTLEPTATIPPVTLTATPEPTPDADPIISILFTGQIVPARCVQAEVDARGSADYIYEAVSSILMSADLTVGTLNAALSDNAPRTGCIETFVLVGGSNNADAMANAGIDLLSVATNHIKNCGPANCGDTAFLDTLDNLARVGILPVGAGLNLEAALSPVYVEIRGVVFGFVSLGEIEPLAFADEDSPGIAHLTEEALTSAILAARENADVVIVLPHWGPEYSHQPNPFQLRMAEVAVAAGADLVVGNHTHYIQGYELLNGVPVFYGLGNFVFDQTQERARQQSLILRVIFEGDRYVTFELIPVASDKTGKVSVVGQNENVEILRLLETVNAKIRR